MVGRVTVTLQVIFIDKNKKPVPNYEFKTIYRGRTSEIRKANARGIATVKALAGQQLKVIHVAANKFTSNIVTDGIGMGDTDERDITTRGAGLSNRHNLQGGASPRWHGSGLGHSQIKDDDSHSGWITGIAQYGLTTSSEVSLSFDDTPNQIGMHWSVNTGSRANAQTPTSTSSATFAPDEHVLELGVLRHRFSNHQSTTSGHGINLATDHSLQATADSGVLLSTFGIRHNGNPPNHKTPNK